MTIHLPMLARAVLIALAIALAASALATSITVTFKPLVDTPLPIRPNDIAIAADRAYVIGSGDCGERDGLRVIDLADAAAPVVGRFVCVEDPLLPLFSVAAEGMVAVVRTSPHPSTLVVIDAADPDAPRVVGRVTDIPETTEAMRFLDDTRLVLRSDELEHQPIGLTLVDLTDASAPVVSSRLALPDRSSSDSSDALGVFGDVIYAIEDDIRIVRATEAGQLEQIGTVPIPTLHGWDMRLIVDTEQTRLYALDDDQHRLWTYDIRRPEAPTLLATGVQLPFPSIHVGLKEVAVADGIAYVNTGVKGEATSTAVAVLDLSDPHWPRLVGDMTPISARDMAISQAGEVLFVGLEDYALPDGTRASRGRLFSFTPEIKRRWLAWLPALASRDEVAP